MIYDIFMAPLEKGLLKNIRQFLIPHASGQVLEIGFGTGVNYSYYQDVESLTGLDLWIDNKVIEKFDKVRFVEGDAHQLPFEDNSFDCVVSTLTLCSVKDQEKVISEIHRVLKPGGQYLFIEHILPQDRKNKLFRMINPLWYKVSQSCQLTHETDKLLRSSQFELVNENYSESGIFYSGIAKKKEGAN